MKKTFTINSRSEELNKKIQVTFEEIKCVFAEEDNMQDSLFIHIETDEFGDGDGVICCEMPDTDEEAEQLFYDNFLDKCFEIDENNVYHIGLEFIEDEKINLK